MSGRTEFEQGLQLLLGGLGLGVELGLLGLGLGLGLALLLSLGVGRLIVTKMEQTPQDNVENLPTISPLLSLRTFRPYQFLLG